MRIVACARSYFTGAPPSIAKKRTCVMIVYDANTRKSFESLGNWLEQIDDHTEGIVKMVVAAKAEGEVAAPSPAAGAAAGAVAGDDRVLDSPASGFNRTPSSSLGGGAALLLISDRGGVRRA